MAKLFLSNIPYDCGDAELRQWVEASGFQVESILMIRDLVTGASPAFAYIQLHDTDNEIDAVRILDGQSLRGRTIQVKTDWRLKRSGSLKS